MSKIFKRIAVSVILLSAYTLSYAQVIPSDSFLLRKIFGQVNKGGKLTTVKVNEEDYPEMDVTELEYSVGLKQNIVLEGEKLLLVICPAKVGMAAGMDYGVFNYYFFKWINDKWKVSDSIVSNELLPIGESPEFKIVEIGIVKKALVFTYASSGQHHIETTIFLYEIQKESIKTLGQIMLSYSNNAWVDLSNVTPEDECPLESYEGTYEIIKSKKEYYDIKVITKGLEYESGCNNEKEVTNVIKYSYDYPTGEYIELLD